MEIPSEIWTRGVFPFLSQESIILCLPLFLVSKGWYSMMCQVDTHVIVGEFDDSAYTILAKRIGNSTRLLVANSDMIMVKDVYYPNLEILSLTGQAIPNSISRFEILDSIKLKSLTLCGYIPVTLIAQFINLEHLSMRYLCDRDDEIILPKNLKRIHIVCAYGDISPKCVSEIQGLNLDYLESDILLFWKLAYAGMGRALRDGCNPFSYEGEWLGGKYHGRGVFKGVGFECSGEWVDGVIQYGTFIRYMRGVNAVYRDDLVNTVHLICAHGQGKMTIGDQCYEGYFTNGYYNNDKSLACIVGI
jgi:hypothetical protein